MSSSGSGGGGMPCWKCGKKKRPGFNKCFFCGAASDPGVSGQRPAGVY